MLFPMLTRRLTERTVRAGRLTMVWSAYFWCNPILFQSAASLIRCRLLARRSIGLPIGLVADRLAPHGASANATVGSRGGFLLAARAHDASFAARRYSPL